MTSSPPTNGSPQTRERSSSQASRYSSSNEGISRIRERPSSQALRYSPSNEGISRIRERPSSQALRYSSSNEGISRTRERSRSHRSPPIPPATNPTPDTPQKLLHRRRINQTRVHQRDSTDSATLSKYLPPIPTVFHSVIIGPDDSFHPPSWLLQAMLDVAASPAPPPLAPPFRFDTNQSSLHHNATLLSTFDLGRPSLTGSVFYSQSKLKQICISNLLSLTMVYYSRVGIGN